ncbi:MAG: 50S ribosomal protein L17 [Acidobacteria bacterium]|nr:50S ribosomal protein L17 [Acidobacteriota bacterium]
MRHRNFGRKLSRNTSHRRALLRNLVTSLIQEERIETTVAKAKAAQNLAEKMITLGKRGGLHARRQAASYLMTAAALKKLFEDVGKRFAKRAGGFTRMVRTGWRQGDGADLAVLELMGTQVLQKHAEARAKRIESVRQRQEQEAKKAEEQVPPPDEGDDKK